MNVKVYPDLQKICRLCLKENEGTISIFPKECTDKYSALSIPIRIMACTSLEVQDSDDFPKKICTDCRFQLEKSYYFRKRSQASDYKLKKHLRTVSMGKISQVFAENMDGVDDEGELEFKLSLEFIQEQDNKKKLEEIRKFEDRVSDIKLQYERELEAIKKTLGTKNQEQLEPLIKEDSEVKVKNEQEEYFRESILDQSLMDDKDLFREECEQSEGKCVQTYLANKKQISKESPTKIKLSKKSPQIMGNDSKQECVQIETQSQREEGENASNQIVMKEELNISDEECDSDVHLLTHNADEGLEVQNKMPGNEGFYTNNYAINMEDEEMKNYASETLDKNKQSQEATTRSCIIDNESGEVQFLITELPDNPNGNFMEEFEEANCSQPIKEISSEGRFTKLIVSPSVTRKKTRVRANVVTEMYVNPMQRSTDTPKIFKCNDCPMVFSTKHSLERHLRSHEKGESLGVTFQCPECHIVVSCSSALRRHMYTHYEKKPFSCNLCGKSFVQNEILKQHMRSHSGIKPHQCPHCDRAFAQRINLTQHINRLHLQEPRIQQHSCHLCPKRFNHASGLSRHLATHSGAIFHCSECNRTFGNRASIKRHIANAHTNTNASKTQDKVIV